ncbi:hypothetical protein SAMN05421688_3244 [Poseidonocella pacifica]|uniref:SEC-C motif-containing protein n=1 Tax=Poseidonocella pacifica TaxID=871651 RepID=A0A1I0YN73_9RHOB|nr:hypothetical protein [Poseidonocella pacifica]SFB14849.1 hypothetical protein SAMN05421688_3244 [Poseidonocella pacifica]
MSDEVEIGFMEARAVLQSECLKVLPAVRRQVDAHRQTFIWQMDKGLANSIFGIPIEKAHDARLTSEQVRRIARENGKNYCYTCMAITPKVLALSLSIERLSHGTLSPQEELNCFRSLIERLAVLEAALEAMSRTVRPEKIKTFDDLIEVREAVSTLIGTRFDWSKLQLIDFSKMPSKTDYFHDSAETRVDLSARNILNQIDKLQKKERYKGIRPFYNFCCEFVHPNIGDILATTSEKQIIKTQGGQLAYKTKYHEDPSKISKDDRDFFILFSKAYAFGTMLIREAEKVTLEYGNLLNTVRRVNRKCAHKVVKRQIACFSKDDYCPCGSGRSIRACAFRRERP